MVRDGTSNLWQVAGCGDQLDEKVVGISGKAGILYFLVAAPLSMCTATEISFVLLSFAPSGTTRPSDQTKDAWSDNPISAIVHPAQAKVNSVQSSLECMQYNNAYTFAPDCSS